MFWKSTGPTVLVIVLAIALMTAATGFYAIPISEESLQLYDGLDDSFLDFVNSSLGLSIALVGAAATIIIALQSVLLSKQQVRLEIRAAFESDIADLRKDIGDADQLLTQIISAGTRYAYTVKRVAENEEFEERSIEDISRVYLKTIRSIEEEAVDIEILDPECERQFDDFKDELFRQIGQFIDERSAWQFKEVHAAREAFINAADALAFFVRSRGKSPVMQDYLEKRVDSKLGEALLGKVEARLEELENRITPSLTSDDYKIAKRKSEKLSRALRLEKVLDAIGSMAANPVDLSGDQIGDTTGEKESEILGIPIRHNPSEQVRLASNYLPRFLTLSDAAPDSKSGVRGLPGDANHIIEARYSGRSNYVRAIDVKAVSTSNELENQNADFHLVCYFFSELLSAQKVRPALQEYLRSNGVEKSVAAQFARVTPFLNEAKGISICDPADLNSGRRSFLPKVILRRLEAFARSMEKFAHTIEEFTRTIEASSRER